MARTNTNPASGGGVRQTFVSRKNAAELNRQKLAAQAPTRPHARIASEWTWVSLGEATAQLVERLASELEARREAVCGGVS